jgi:outer membrane receptor protein involved in Fe transport
MRRVLQAFAALLLLGTAAYATVFGTVRGIVHDPQHRPVSGSEVVLKAKSSDYTQKTQTDANGEFHFDAVPLGTYTVTVTDAAFAGLEQSVTVLSGTAPILHFEMHIASQSESVTVSAEAAPGQTESVTPTTLVDRMQIQETAGATKTNSLAIITDYVPGAYFTHDQLHVRGGHQVSWLIDGVSIPNTNIASNLGPQVDPKDIDAIEMQRGSYAADFGDRTYGIFDVLPRTGFERNDEAELVLSAGNFYQTDDQINFGGHTNRFAYYASANGNRTNLGLQTPTSAVLHDAANGYGGFVSLIYNADSQDQFRFVAQARRDYYQVPFDPNNPLNSPGATLLDANRENDSFAAFSWVRTFSPGLVLTVSPFFHYNSVSYVSNPNDFPSATTQNRSSKYEGGQGTVSWIAGPNNARAGFYSFAQQDDQFFHVIYNDGSATITPLSQNPDGSLIAVYVEDQIKVNSWLTLNGGLRQTHFSGGVVENATSPRVGGSVRIPKLNWVFRGFYGHFYQAPPLGTLSGPTLNDIQTQQQLDFVPLRGERDEEHQFGVTIPFKGWTLDADNFLTRAKNFFDHNSLNSSNVFFPVDVQGARINGWELTLRSPRIRNRAQVYVTYSNQLGLGFGCVIGGLIGSCATPPPGFFFLDHDQRDTLHLGGQYTLPWRAYASTDVYYASGFSNSNPAIPGDHLQPHTTFDLSLGKNFGERFSVNVQGLNVANRRVLLDNSFTFGGTHFINPREIFVQLRFRFHY